MEEGDEVGGVDWVDGSRLRRTPPPNLPPPPPPPTTFSCSSSSLLPNRVNWNSRGRHKTFFGILCKCMLT